MNNNIGCEELGHRSPMSVNGNFLCVVLLVVSISAWNASRQNEIGLRSMLDADFA